MAETGHHPLRTVTATWTTVLGQPRGRSDNASFARSIPVIWYHTDGHPDYHQPSDHAALLNWEKVEKTKASFLNVWNLANESNY